MVVNGKKSKEMLFLVFCSLIFSHLSHASTYQSIEEPALFGSLEFSHKETKYSFLLEPIKGNPSEAKVICSENPGYFSFSNGTVYHRTGKFKSSKRGWAVFCLPFICSYACCLPCISLYESFAYRKLRNLIQSAYKYGFLGDYRAGEEFKKLIISHVEEIAKTPSSELHYKEDLLSKWSKKTPKELTIFLIQLNLSHVFLSDEVVFLYEETTTPLCESKPPKPVKEMFIKMFRKENILKDVLDSSCFSKYKKALEKSRMKSIATRVLRSFPPETPLM